MKKTAQDSPEERLQKQLEENLSGLNDGEILTESPKEVSFIQADAVINRVAMTHSVSKKTASIAIVSLMRKGIANAGATDKISVQVKCMDTGTETVINRYDIGMALQAIVGHNNIRKFAEAIAPNVIKVDVKRVQENPQLNLKGDLANKINRKLIARKEPTLTRVEEVCCATYSQWIPNLNEYASSTRLKALLEQDLYESRERKKKTKQTNQRQANSRPVKDQTNVQGTSLEQQNRPLPKIIQEKQTPIVKSGDSGKS